MNGIRKELKQSVNERDGYITEEAKQEQIKTELTTASEDRS